MNTKMMAVAGLIVVSSILSQLSQANAQDNARSQLHQIQTRQRLQTPIRRIPVPNDRTKLSGANPVAKAIEFRIIRREVKHRGRVQITGVVKNTGVAEFKGRGSEALLMSKNQIIARASISSLRPGQEMRLKYVTNWDSASPNEGEFPPTFKLKIVHRRGLGGPNGDVSLRDNQRSRSGADMNELFSRRVHPGQLSRPIGPPPVAVSLR